MTNRIDYRTTSGRYGTARLVDEVPAVEELNFSCGCDQIISCTRMDDAIQSHDSDEGFYEFYQVTEFWGSQCDDPEEYESNHESYAIAVFCEYGEAD